MKLITAFARTGLNVIGLFHSILGNDTMRVISSWLRKISRNRIPQWNQFMPAGAKKIDIKTYDGKDKLKKVVYFPSCINRSMGVSKDHRREPQLTEKMLHLMEKPAPALFSQKTLTTLSAVWHSWSKGVTSGLIKSANLRLRAEGDNNGNTPYFRYEPLPFHLKETWVRHETREPVEFILIYLLTRLIIVPLDEEVSVVRVCSRKEGSGQETLLSFATALGQGRSVSLKLHCGGFLRRPRIFLPWS